MEIEGGSLAIGHRPSSKLATDLKLQNATHILTLLSEGEKAQSITEKNGLEWLWFPMVSAQPPDEDRNSELLTLFNEMEAVLENSGKIYVHCSVGIHRTGMISYAFLRFLVKDAEEAIKQLKALRVKICEEVEVERVAWGDSVIRNLN